jgi:hypothetical protein
MQPTGPESAVAPELRDEEPASAAGIAVRPAPSRTGLESVRPNPTRQGVEIVFGVVSGDEGAASLTVFDVSGRRIATLVDGMIEPGWTEIRWDGRDANGVKTVAGVYFLRLTVGERVDRRKIVKVR